MIQVKDISKSFGSLNIFKDFTLMFPEGKITVILGPSGCGKTTLLNILARIVPVDRGEVDTAENVSYLFQEPRLLPWLTIRQNIVLVFKDKYPEAVIKEKIDQNLTAAGLANYADYYPSQLSGGMRQRAAMARAFSYDAPLLLMDEPFKSLDLKTRFQLIGDFLKLWRTQKKTAVMVTHDLKEAVMMGDLIVILSEKPARVIEMHTVDVVPDDRTDNREIIKLEERLMRALLKG